MFNISSAAFLWTKYTPSACLPFVFVLIIVKIVVDTAALVVDSARLVRGR